MPFDPAIFEAEVALKLIPTERLPALALDALESGFDGPYVVRMAILDPTPGWEIDHALPRMLAELGCQQIPPLEAALRLACHRAQRILATAEDPLPSMPYFYHLMVAADYPTELHQLGWFDDYGFDFSNSLDETRTRAREALCELLAEAG